MATLAAKSTVKVCFKGQTCKKQVTDVIIEIARWRGVALTASDINNDNIEKYLDALDIPIDFISLVQPSDIGERVTMTGVDVLVKHGMDTDKAKEFLQNLTFEQSHLMAIAVSDRMGDSFFEDVVLKTYERYGGENQLASESNSNSDSQTSTSNPTGSGTVSGAMPPNNDNDDNKNDSDKGDKKGVGGNGAASDLPGLNGKSPDDARKLLEGQGFSGGKTSPNGWQTFRGKDGSKVDINWNTGRVVRTAAPKYGQNGSTINKGQRLDSSGSEIPRNLPHELHPTETINFK